MPCPDENVLDELARGEISAQDRTELEAHLDECEACSQVVADLMRIFASSFSGSGAPEPEPSGVGLDSTVAGDHEPTESWPTDRPQPEGAKLGRYVVLRSIGAGAMGIVYAAYDPELDRKVALKLLRRRTGDDAGDEHTLRASPDKRLLREAQALARLTHPNVITVHDVGAWEDQVFLAMEFVEGGTLTEWLRKGPRPWRDVLRVFRQAGEGLAAAHEAGLVHRDFKPDNVLIHTDGRAVVTDFGLARATDDDDHVDSEVSDAIRTSGSGSALAETLTRTGALVGTPAYMAPEQLDGKRSGAAADQFGFCVALYEGLYGERPFQAKTLTGLITAVYANRVPPPPRGSTVPRWLRQAIVRGLRVRPHERHPDMRALLTALRPARLGSWRGAVVVGVLGATVGAVVVAVSASPADPAAYCDDVASRLSGAWDEAARDDVRRSFGASGLAFADDAAARVIEGLDAHATQWVEAQGEVCRREVEGREPATVIDVRMSCLAQRRSTLGGMATALRSADADAVLSAIEAVHALPSVADCLDPGLQPGGLAPIPEAERDAVADVREQLAKVTALRTLGKVKLARSEIDEVTRRAEGIGYGPLRAELAEARAESLRDSGEPEPAEAAMLQALQLAVAHDHDAVLANVAIELGLLELDRMAPPAAIERWVGLGLAALESLGGSWPHQRASLLALRGDAQRQAGDFEASIATLQEVLALREQHWGPTHHAVAEPLGALGLAYARKGDHAASVAHIERARTILRATYGDQHPNYAVSLQNLATTHFVHGHYADALALYQEALRLFEASLGPRHPSVAVLAYNVATTQLFMERFDDALVLVQRAQDIENAAYGARSRAAAVSWALIGEIHLRTGRLPRAEAALRQALAIHEEVAPDERAIHANYDSQLGHVLAEAGRLTEAEALLDQTLRAQRTLVGEPSIAVAETAGRLAMVMLAQGRLPEARVLVDASVRQYESEDPDPHQHAEAWFRQARVLAAAGDATAARAAAERARALYAERADQPSRLEAVERWLALPVTSL